MAPDRSRSTDSTRRAMLGVLRSVGARPRHEVYFSTPITTGETFVEWRRNGDVDDGHPDYEALHHEHVVTKNLERVGPIVASLRQRFADRLVIDPTGLDAVDGWAQSDYHEFWCSVVAKYAAQIVFADGWQYSNGCVTEFAAAARDGIPMFTEDLAPLDPRQGVRLVADAVAELARLGERPVELGACLARAEQATRHRGAPT